MLGSVVDSLGHSLHSSRPVASDLESFPVIKRALGLSDRKTIKEPFLTGISVIDLMVPLGRGQRELLLGDRKTGKTTFALQILLSEANKDMICIYACIGKKKADIKRVEDFIVVNKIQDRCIIIASSAGDSLGQIYLTPYSAMTLAEYFRDKGRDVLLVLDDMTTHAKYYREISLVAQRFPGRESYPGDIFYAHSALLERAGNFNTGSITCFPLVNTVEHDISGYIQTNLMSMTDGHIFFDQELFNSGRRPAVNYFYSVTRVGRQTQDPLRWSINRELNSFFALYRRTENFIHFGAELNQGIKSTLDLGSRVIAFFNQKPEVSLDINLQMIFICILWSGIWNSKPEEEIDSAVSKVMSYYKNDENFRNSMLQLVKVSTDLNNLLGNFMKDLHKVERYIL
jgi:F-type H+/Na+-transporting ATPase subunit alpha